MNMLTIRFVRNILINICLTPGFVWEKLCILLKIIWLSILIMFYQDWLIVMYRTLGYIWRIICIIFNIIMWILNVIESKWYLKLIFCVVIFVLTIKYGHSHNVTYNDDGFSRNLINNPQHRTSLPANKIRDNQLGWHPLTGGSQVCLGDPNTRIPARVVGMAFPIDLYSQLTAGYNTAGGNQPFAQSLAGGLFELRQCGFFRVTPNNCGIEVFRYLQAFKAHSNMDIDPKLVLVNYDLIDALASTK